MKASKDNSDYYWKKNYVDVLIKFNYKSKK